MSDCNEFCYQSLGNTSRQIRILNILPENSDTIHCSLRHVEPDEEAYTCLSYCWGNEDDTSHRILINGCKFKVRFNLYHFLQTAQNLHIDGWLWIDAICINQGDLVEKSAQVEMMGQIYSLATNTIIWLGSPMENVDVLYDIRYAVAGTQRQTEDEEPALEDELRKDQGESYKGEQPQEHGESVGKVVQEVVQHLEEVGHEELDDGTNSIDEVDCYAIRWDEFDDDAIDSILFEREITAMLDLRDGLGPVKYVYDKLGGFETESFKNDQGDIDYPLQEKLAIERITRDNYWLESCAAFLKDYIDTIRTFQNARHELETLATNRYWARAWITQLNYRSKCADILTTRGSLKVDNVRVVLNVFNGLERFQTQIKSLKKLPELSIFLSNDGLTTGINGRYGRRLSFLSTRSSVDRKTNRGPLKIFMALPGTANSGCSDLRDRVFSINSLLSLEQRIVVDYSMTREDLFIAVLAACVSEETIEDPPDDHSGFCRKGARIFSTARQLRDALQIYPPNVATIPSQEYLFKYYSFSHTELKTARWGIPDGLVMGPNLDGQEWDKNIIAGLYVHLMTYSAQRLVLEFLFEDGPIESTDEWFELQPKSMCMEKPRAWIIEQEDVTLYQGAWYAFHWPGIGCACHPLDVSNIIDDNCDTKLKSQISYAGLPYL